MALISQFVKMGLMASEVGRCYCPCKWGRARKCAEDMAKELISILEELQQTLGENQSGVSLLTRIWMLLVNGCLTQNTPIYGCKTGFTIHLMSQICLKEKDWLLLKKIQISPDDVLAVGDALNDISMFEYLGRSVAVGGCFQELAMWLT